MTPSDTSVSVSLPQTSATPDNSGTGTGTGVRTDSPSIMHISLSQGIGMSKVTGKTSDTVSTVASSVVSVSVDDTEGGDKKKKKKKNNESESIPESTEEEVAVMTRCAGDYHPYGGCTVLIYTLLEKSSQECDTVVKMSTVPVPATVTATATATLPIPPTVAVSVSGLGTGSVSGSGKVETSKQIEQISKFMRERTPFLMHFFRDLKHTQNEEVAKVLR